MIRTWCHYILWSFWDGTDPGGLINVCLDVSNALTKAREVDGLRRAMGQFDLDGGLVLTLNHSETMSLDKWMIEFLPYRIWALQRMKSTQDKT